MWEAEEQANRIQETATDLGAEAATIRDNVFLLIQAFHKAADEYDEADEGAVSTIMKPI